MTPVTVVLAEDNLLVRGGLVSLLAASATVRIVAACASLPEAQEAIDTHRPQVVLTDIQMPPTFSDEGVRLARQLRRSYPAVGVVVISQFDDPSYAAAVLGEGSSRRAYLLKDGIGDLDRLERAVAAVAAGDSFIDDEIMRALVRARTQQGPALIDSLTVREREVLAEVAAGASNSAIAGNLHVTGHAVEKHIGSIFAKLGLFDGKRTNRRVQAALLHLRAGAPPGAAVLTVE